MIEDSYPVAIDPEELREWVEWVIAHLDDKAALIAHDVPPALVEFLRNSIQHSKES